MQNGHTCEHGPDAYSYGTCIRTQLPDGTWVLNVTKYSQTTSRHQRALNGTLRGIEISGAPKGISAEELRALGAAKQAEPLHECGRTCKGWDEDALDCDQARKNPSRSLPEGVELMSLAAPASVVHNAIRRAVGE